MYTSFFWKITVGGIWYHSEYIQNKYMFATFRIRTSSRLRGGSGAEWLCSLPENVGSLPRTAKIRFITQGCHRDSAGKGACHVSWLGFPSLSWESLFPNDFSMYQADIKPASTPHKPRHLSLVPETYVNWKERIGATKLSPDLHVHAYTHTHTHIMDTHISCIYTLYIHT